MRLAALLIVCLLTAQVRAADKILPGMMEDVDEISILYVTGEIGQGNRMLPQVLFWQGGVLVARRVLTREMQQQMYLFAEGENTCIAWPDCECVDRVVRARHYSVFVCEEDPFW